MVLSGWKTKLVTYLHLHQTLQIHGDIPPLLHTFSWQVYLCHIMKMRTDTESCTKHSL